MATKTDAALALLKKFYKKGEALVRNLTPTELLVLSATNDDAWGPTGAQLKDIAEASFDAEKFGQAWRTILRRFEGEPAHWRRCYKALLLTEHLLKNSSQHVVQRILECADVIEGLKRFKYLDEKNKDQGINVSNRAKELSLLLADPERIRAERAKARALKDKFKGSSRADVAAGAAPAPSAGSWTAEPAARPAPSAGSTRGGGPASEAATGARFGQLGAATAPTRRGPLPGEASGRLTPAPGNEEQEPAGGPGSSAQRVARSPVEGPADGGADAQAATARRIAGLRAAGMLGSDPPNPAAPVGGATPASRSHDDLRQVAQPGGSQSGKPSLQELMARKSGPRRLQDVRVNPAIGAALGGVKLALPPAPGPHAAASPGGSTSSAALPPPPPRPMATGAAQAQPHECAASSSPVGSGSPAGGSPWQAGSPASPVAASPTFGDFSHSPAPLGAGAGRTVSLMAASGSQPPALPAHLFAEPAPPAYGTVGWGTHLAGGAPLGGSPTPSGGPPEPPAVVVAFAEVDPFRA